MAPRLRLLLLLLPAGCAAPGEREAVAMRAALESGQASLAAVAPPASPAVPLVLVGGAARPLPQQPIPRHERPPTAARFDAAGTRPASAAELLGAGPETLRRWLGEPVLRRPEGGAEVWLYAGAGCALDVILYPAGHGLSVAHAAARAQGAEPRTEAACLGEIAAAQDGHRVPASGGPAVRVADQGI
ncbi:hypothetical protein ACFQS7_13080 [Dankookia sp. GCM10030260]|uniref:hypothetical protein n=1 Tax=Dankookia sp. GCM10030260 TaxID=3273390 RepID=UPI003618F238